MDYKRRRFIKQCFALYGSLLLYPSCNNTQGNTYLSFPEEEGRCIEAICDQFIPEDDYPGAVDAGVVRFIDKLLYQRFPELAEKYVEGISSLQRYCSETYKQKFTQLDKGQQADILRQMEKNGLPADYWTGISQTSFFEMVLKHTMQGYYGSPRHGGNKDYASYRMMKLDYPLLIGQNRYGK